MQTKRLVVVTNLLPKYQIDFFNEIVERNKNIELIVLADITTTSPLNQFHKYDCNFKVINDPIINFKGLLFRKNLLKKIREASPDFLLFYGNPREVSITLSMISLAISRKKFVVHGMFHRIGGQRIVSNIYYKFIGMIACRCYTYSSMGARVLLNLGTKPKKVKVIGTAIDEQKSFYYSSLIDDKQLNVFKKENNITDRKVILQVVRLSKQKKPELILKIAEEIKSLNPEILFILIGGGELYDYLDSQIKKLKLENTVKLLGPIYDEAILAYWFRSAEALLVPSCIGLSAHHAFSYGLPVITDDNLITQASEFDILVDNLNSLLYESGNINSLKVKILKIINDKELQHFLSRNALHTVKYKYNLMNKCTNYMSNLVSYK